MRYLLQWMKTLLCCFFSHLQLWPVCCTYGAVGGYLVGLLGSWIWTYFNLGQRYFNVEHSHKKKDWVQLTISGSWITLAVSLGPGRTNSAESGHWVCWSQFWWDTVPLDGCPQKSEEAVKLWGHSESIQRKFQEKERVHCQAWFCFLLASFDVVDWCFCHAFMQSPFVKLDRSNFCKLLCWDCHQRESYSRKESARLLDNDFGHYVAKSSPDAFMNYGHGGPFGTC